LLEDVGAFLAPMALVFSETDYRQLGKSNAPSKNFYVTASRGFSSGNSELTILTALAKLKTYMCTIKFLKMWTKWSNYFHTYACAMHIHFIGLRVACTNVDQNSIADQRNFRAKYLHNSEENWTKK